MPEDDPIAFSLFIEWVYNGALPNVQSQGYVDSLYDLYIFAEKICMNSSDMKDYIMDKIQDVSRSHNLLPTPATVRKVYHKDRSEDSNLNLFCVQVLVFDLTMKWGNREVVGADWMRRKSFMDNLKQELGGLLELCKDNETLFNHFVWELYFKNNPEEAAVDPRRRDDSRPNSRCRFHGYHGNGNVCYQDKK